MSTWIGTNDTPSTGYWSPSNPAGMTLVSQNFYDQWQSTLPAPAAPTLSVASGGSQPDTAYYVKVTLLDSNGESLASSESSIDVPAGDVLVVASPASAGDATSYNVYVGTASGQDGLQNSTPISLGTAYTLPDSAIAIGRGVPVSGVGDGNLTQTTLFPGGSQAPRITQSYFDWRDRQVAGKSGIILNTDGTENLTAEADGTNRPIEFSVYDNLGEVTAQEMFTGDGVAVTTTAGVVNAPSTDLLRAKFTSTFDDQGNAYETNTFSVDPTDGTVGDALTSDTFRDLRGNVIASYTGGSGAMKAAFDGAGRQTMSYATDGGAVNNSGTPLLDYNDAASVTNDVVVSQSENVLDANGNPIETIQLDRLPVDSTSAEGALGNASGTGGPAARVSYAANYFDTANRPIASENVGTNGGSAWTRPSTPDTSDATHLVNSMTYNSQGLEATSTDPRGIVNATLYNLLGETTETIAAYTDGTPTASTNQTTEFTYNGEGAKTTMTAVMPSGTPSQTTAWIYGVSTTGGSTINSNDLLAKEEFPDATTGAASTSASNDVAYTVDNLGEVLTMTDQNQTTHSFGRDLLGRQTSDSVTVLGSGVDGSVRLRTQTHDQQGNVYQMTAYADTGGLTLVNQVQDVYNGLGQPTGVYQSNSGAVDTATTAETQYTYSDPTSGSLMTAMTYPNGRVLDYGRDNNALDMAIGRVDYLADAGGSSAGHLVDYLYLGQGTMVQQADANGVKLTYLQQSGDSNAITTGPQYAGDQVTGLGQFGEVVDQNWVNTSTPTPTTTDRFQYNYDQGGNVLYKNNLVNPSASELYHANSTASGDDNTAYDSLTRLTAFERGTLSASSHNSGVLDTVSSPSGSQNFALDAVGNQTAVTTDGTTVDNTSNSKNELTANGSNSLSFDNNGNTLTDQSGQQYVYDAWNHVAAAKNSSGMTIATYTYAANGNRITETAGGTTTGFYCNGSQIIEERQGSTVTKQNVFNMDYVNDLLLRDDNSAAGSLGKTGSGLGQRLFAQHDANFNVTSLTSASGTVLERYEYSPYGTVTILNPDGTVRGDGTIASSEHGVLNLFQGMRFDPVTGLYATLNRDLNPATGTWMQADPSGYGDGTSLYSIELGRPTDLTDPAGLAGFNPYKFLADQLLEPAPGKGVGRFRHQKWFDDLYTNVTKSLPASQNLSRLDCPGLEQLLLQLRIARLFRSISLQAFKAVGDRELEAEHLTPIDELDPLIDNVRLLEHLSVCCIAIAAVAEIGFTV